MPPTTNKGNNISNRSLFSMDNNKASQQDTDWFSDVCAPTIQGLLPRGMGDRLTFIQKALISPNSEINENIYLFTSLCETIEIEVGKKSIKTLKNTLNATCSGETRGDIVITLFMSIVEDIKKNQGIKLTTTSFNETLLDKLKSLKTEDTFSHVFADHFSKM